MLSFLVTTVAISLSGVMAPGPITTATLAAGVRSRHAGALIAVGHALVEMPLILLLAAGAGSFLTSPTAKVGIGIAGGIVLVMMGLQLLLSLIRSNDSSVTQVERHPLLIGIALTIANPYFLIWWATVGLSLALQAMTFGLFVLVLFAIVHWLCDLIWLEVLSLAGYTGSELFGRRAQWFVSCVCGIVLLGFGLHFLVDAATDMLAGTASAAR